MLAIKQKIKSWYLKTLENNQEEFYNKSLIIKIFCLIGTISYLTLGTWGLIKQMWILSTFIYSSAILFTLFIILSIRKKNFLIAQYLTTTYISILLLSLMTNTNIYETGIIWSLLFPACSLFVLGIRKGIILSLIYLVITVLLIFLPLPFINKSSSIHESRISDWGESPVFPFPKYIADPCSK